MSIRTYVRSFHVLLHENKKNRNKKTYSIPKKKNFFVMKKRQKL